MGLLTSSFGDDDNSDPAGDGRLSSAGEARPFDPGRFPILPWGYGPGPAVGRDGRNHPSGGLNDALSDADLNMLASAGRMLPAARLAVSGQTQDRPALPGNAVMVPRAVHVEPVEPAPPRPPQEWIDKFGPHVAATVRNTRDLGLALLGIVGPQADMKGMVDSAQDSGEAFQRGDYGKAAADFGIAAASPLGLLFPGTIRGYVKGGDAVADAMRPLDVYNSSSTGKGAGNGVGRPGTGLGDGGHNPPLQAQSAPAGSGPAASGAAPTTPEGVSLVGSREIVGQRYPGGPNEPLSPEASRRVLSQLTDYLEVPKSKLKMNVDGDYKPPHYPSGYDRYGNSVPYEGDLRRGTARVRRDLPPKLRIETEAHEFSHDIDINHTPGGASRSQSEKYIADLKAADSEQLQKELRLISQKQYPQDWTSGDSPRLMPGLSPKRAAYAESIREKFARIGAFYATDPERTKREFPEAAKMFRIIWNNTPRAVKEIGFNQLIPAIAAGAAAALIADGSGDAEAGWPSE